MNSLQAVGISSEELMLDGINGIESIFKS